MPAPTTWLDTFTVNGVTAGAQDQPVVLQLATGNILVGYRSGGTGNPADPAGSNILGSIFAPDGTAIVRDMLLNSAMTAGDESQPSLVALPDGGFAIAYLSRATNGSTNIGIDHYDADRNFLASTIVVADIGSGHPMYSEPHLAIDGDGNAVIAYVATDATGVGGVEAASYDWSSNTIGTISRSNTGPHIYDLDLASKLDGTFSIAYTYEGTSDAGDSRVNTNTLNALGVAQFAAGTIPGTSGNGASDTEASIAALTTDARIFAYTDGDGAIVVQRYVFGGTPTSSVTLGPGLGTATHPSAATLADGSFVVAFEVDDGPNPGVYAAVYSAFLDLQGISLVAAGSANDTPSVAALADGRFVVSWYDADINISMKILGGNGSVSPPVGSGFYTYQVGTPGNDAFVADDASFYVYGGPGNDTITETYDTHTFGGTGDDILIVTSMVESGFEAEFHDGGPGTDTIDWSGVDQEGLTFDLASGYVYAGYPIQNVMTGFENVIGTAHDDLVYGTGAANLLHGGGGNDTIFGGGGGDLFDGGDGIDTATYEYGSSSVKINLTTGIHGGDAAGDSFTSIEIFLLSDADDVFTGSAGVDTVKGLGGNDRLNGGAGADVMAGGAGNDVYIVDDAGDVVTELAGQGSDRVESSVSYTLGDNVENLYLTGSALTGTGNALANLVKGNSQNNILDGGAGADDMRGGKGEDVYVVDNVGDKVVELDGEGNDTVNSSVTFSLANQYIEVLNLTGSAAVNGTGNGLNNRIVGNSAANTLVGGDGNDRLDGGAGADTLKGGLGNDTYVVENAGDKITENNGDGTDTVEAWISYSLVGQYIETLKLMGSDNLGATGNGQVNTLYGNAGNNLLNGMAGADTMAGGAGDDTYVVDDAGDKVIENAGEGTDLVQSSVTFSLANQYIEALTLTGSAAANGTGNNQANTLTGNTAANTLNGSGGDDQLHGGLGSDTLTGGAGLDTFWFETALGASNVDTITDFKAADDTINLDRTIFSGITANGALAGTAFYQGAAAHDADDRIVYDKASGNLYYDADGTGAGAAVLFAHVADNTALTAADFFAVA